MREFWRPSSSRARTAVWGRPATTNPEIQDEAVLAYNPGPDPAIPMTTETLAYNPPPAKPLSEIVTTREAMRCACWAVLNRPESYPARPGKIHRRAPGQSHLEWLTYVAYWRCYPQLPVTIQQQPGKPTRAMRAWLDMRQRLLECQGRVGHTVGIPLPPASAPRPSGPGKPAYPSPTKPSPPSTPQVLQVGDNDFADFVERRYHRGRWYAVYLLRKRLGEWWAYVFGYVPGQGYQSLAMSTYNPAPVAFAGTPAGALRRARERISRITQSF